MSKYHLRIKKAELVPDQFGNHLKITTIGLYEKTPDGEKYRKWVRLDDKILNTLLTTNLEINDEKSE